MLDWQHFNILVIGDVMLDCYLTGTADRLCPEAPVPVVNLTQRQDLPGGAANVAANVAGLGATVLLLSVIGQDAEGDRLQSALSMLDISTRHLISTATRTTLAKHRILAESHLLVRLDQGSTEPIVPRLEQQVIDRLTTLFSHCNAVIVSDYGYGVLTPAVIQTLAALQAQHPCTVVVDAKQLTRYRSVGATAVKPNYAQALQLLELSRKLDDRAHQIASYADRLLHLTGAAIVAVTLDQEGAIVLERGQPPYCTEAKPVPHVQTSGAGDTYVSALTLALASGFPTSKAAFIAAIASTIVVQSPGTVICAVETLKQELRNRPLV